MAKIEVMHVSCKRKRPWAQFLSLSEALFVLKYRNKFSSKPTKEITSEKMKIFFSLPEALFVLKLKDIQGVLEICLLQDDDLSALYHDQSFIIIFLIVHA